MNYTICLDPTSANFNASSISGNGFSVYTDADNFTNPISQNINANQLFAPPLGNCPFTLTNIPSGSTQLLIIDQCSLTTSASISVNISASIPTVDTTCCYALIDIDPCGDWCTECSIGFDNINTSPIGRIIAGDLESSCGTVTDYVIGWYRNGDYSSPNILTGAGNAFNYQFTHPLDATTGPLVLDGNYEGIIHDVIIDGTQYSNLESGSGVGTPIPFESCFGTVVVAPFSCDNGVFPLPYTHQISFTAAGNNLVPPPVSATYTLSSSTDYFAYKFNPFAQVADEIEIKFVSGDPNSTTNPTLYSEPIYLEKLQVGAGVSTNIDSLSNIINNTYPKKYGHHNKLYKRVLTLTESLERTDGDKLEITVTPLGAETSWALQMQCLDDFDCTNCYFDDNPPRVIQSLTLSRNAGDISNPNCLGTTGSCATQQLDMMVSGCNTRNTDLFNEFYFGSTVANNNSDSYIDAVGNNTGSFPNPALNPFGVSLANSATSQAQNQITPNASCDSDETNWEGTISKLNDVAYGISTTGQALGAISMSFNNIDFYNHYKNGLLDTETVLSSIFGPVETDCSNINYYMSYLLYIPIPPTPGTICGDNLTNQSYKISRLSFPNIVFDDINYQIFIPLSEMENCYSCSSDITCCNLNNLCNFVNNVNSDNFVNNNQNVITTTVGTRYIKPFGAQRVKINTSSLTTPKTSSIALDDVSIPLYPILTLPFQPSPTGGWVNYPNLSASVCPDYTSSLPLTSTYPHFRYYGFNMGYRVVYPNLTSSLSDSMNDDFKLYASVQNNSGLYSSSLANSLLIYEYSSSVVTVHEPSFFEGGSPTLTIEPF